MNISLTPELEQMVQAKVKSGRYPSASEVVREALHLMDERDHLEELRQLIAVGIEQADRGELVEGSVVFENIRERIRQKAEQKP